jgi:hypothetical protein
MIMRRLSHRVGLLALGFEYDRARRIDDHFEKGDVKGPEHQRQAEQQRYQPLQRHEHVQRGFGLSVPRLRWSSVHLAARDKSDAAIAKPETRLTRHLQVPHCPPRVSHSANFGD